MYKFKITLETVTPIHIGSGQEYYPTEYYIDKNSKRLYVVDEGKLLDNVENGGELNKFIELSSTYTTKNSALLEFIKKYSSNAYRYIVNLESRAFKYLTSRESAFSSGVSKFIRNSYDDKLYIPGSTFKGSLRNAFIDRIIRALLKKYNYESDTVDNRKSLFRKIGLKCKDLDVLLRTTFPDARGNAQDDIFKFVKVSDFLQNGDVESKIYRVFSIGKPKNNVRDIKAIPDILECVTSKCLFEGHLTIDSLLMKNLKRIEDKLGINVFIRNEVNANNLAQMLRITGVNHYLWESNVFKYDDLTVKNQDSAGVIGSDSVKVGNFILGKLPKDSFYIKMGKHGGAVSKTINGCREIKIKGRDIPQEEQTTLWLAGGYPMGWVKGKVEEMN